MRLQEYEDKIRELWQQNPKDEKIWPLLEQFCYQFFWRKHIMSTNEKNKEASLILAEDLYLKMSSGEEIYHLLGYVGLCYHSAIRKYNKMNTHEVIDTTSNPQLAEAIAQMCISTTRHDVTREAMDIDFIKYLPKFIDNVIENCAYDVNSSNYINAKLSICLSIIKGQFVKYDIPNEELEYVKLLYQNVMLKLKDELSYNVEIDDLQNLSSLQLYTLETYVDKEMNEDYF